MQLAPGSRLGPYEILAPLGAGGMGEVYRARDPRMGREVAIKVSADRFSDRLEQEVHAVAALNHANICQIYDVGPNYLVMELIDGPTLADRIAMGPVPLEEALRIARQIADALEAAHEKGIIHRDLKPPNIKIKPDGTVKVLDFGLAKTGELAAVAGCPEESPTVAMGATMAGQIMGTASYMSPEQARGKTVDRRTDIWAFGVVLYEMLTGRRMFEGETISDTLAGVLTKEPDWHGVPVKTQSLLKNCLEKDPKRRLRDIGDAWRLVGDAPASATRNHTPWIVAGLLALTSALSLWAPWRGNVAPIERPSSRLDLDLGSDVSLVSTDGPAVVLSPDGTRIVFVSEDQDGTARLYTRRLDQPKPTRLVGTEGAYVPFLSPDGQWVGFFASGKLKKTRIEGGDPLPLCDAPSGRGASWGEDGNIIASLDATGGLSYVPSSGGRAVPLTELAPGEDSHRWPHVVQGGKFILFTFSEAAINWDETGIAIFSLQDRQRKTLLKPAGAYPRYLPSGHLAYVTKGSVFAAPLDLKRLEVTGVATRLDDVSTNSARGFAQADFSPSGIFLFRTGGSEGLSTVHWLDASGKTEALPLEAARYSYPRLSPDGSRLAYVMNQGSNSDLWIYDWKRSANRRLTNGLVTTTPIWSPDGRFVIFQSFGGIFYIQADGAGAMQQLLKSKYRQLPNSFSRSGKLVFSELSTANAELRILPVEIGSGKLQAGEPQSLLEASSISTFAAFSPDGRWLAYANANAGPYEIYVRAFPDKGTQVQVSNAGGTMPFWSRNGRELFYRTENQRIMVVNYAVNGESFIPGKPRPWYGGRTSNTGLAVNLDLAPDGKRFIVLMPSENRESRERQSHVTLVTNFFEEVRRRFAGQSK